MATTGASGSREMVGQPPPPEWRQGLRGLPAPAWRYFTRVSSTNDVAWQWAETGAAEGCFVFAEAQTAGRGRHGRRWFTRPGRGLALSLIVRPLPGEEAYLPRYAAWAALAMSEALAQWGLQVWLKWPNDLLLHGHKIGGVLAETRWQGPIPRAAIIGIGLNVYAGSAPPPAAVDFPAGDIASLSSVAVPRPALVAAFWRRWAAWRTRLGQDVFLTAWEARLAYRGRSVQVTLPDGRVWQGTLLGLTSAGGLLLATPQGIRVVQHSGTLRPNSRADALGISA